MAYRVLRHRDFRLLWLSQLVSLTGSQMQTVALNWHVYLLTRSPLALGSLGLTRVVPIVVFSLWGGVVADRHDRRRVMFATQATMLAGAAGARGPDLHRAREPRLLYGANALLAAATAFDNPARQALIPRLVPTAELPGALSLNLTMFHAAFIGGPALAGLLIAGAGLPHAGLAALAGSGASADTARLALIYALNALSFLGVLHALVLMRTSGRVEADGGEPRAAARGPARGPALRLPTPIMVWTTGLDFFATFFSGSLSLLPIFADQVLHVGPRRLRLARGRARAGRARRLPLHLAPPAAGAPGPAPPRLGGLLRRRHRRLRPLALLLADLPRAGPQRASPTSSRP